MFFLVVLALFGAFCCCCGFAWGVLAAQVARSGALGPAAEVAPEAAARGAQLVRRAEPVASWYRSAVGRRPGHLPRVE